MACSTFARLANTAGNYTEFKQADYIVIADIYADARGRLARFFDCVPPRLDGTPIAKQRLASSRACLRHCSPDQREPDASHEGRFVADLPQKEQAKYYNYASEVRSYEEKVSREDGIERMKL